MNQTRGLRVNDLHDRFSLSDRVAVTTGLKVHASFTQVPVFIPTTPRPRLSSVYDDTIFRHDGVLPKWLDVRLAEPQRAVG